MRRCSRLFIGIAFVAFAHAACSASDKTSEQSHDPGHTAGDVDNNAGDSEVPGAVCIRDAIHPDACGDLLPPEVRDPILDAAQSFVAGLAELSQADANEALRAYLAAIPQFVAVGIDAETESVWAIFSDGIVVANPARRLLESALPQATIGASAGAPVRQAVNNADLDMFFEPGDYPERGLVVLHYAAVEDPNWNNVPELEQWFTDKKYHPIPGSAAIPEFEALENAGAHLGMYYFNGHGGAYATTGGGKSGYIVSSTARTKANDVTYHSMLSEGYLGHSLDGHYLLLESFLARYLRFGKHGIAIVDGCTSQTPTMRNLFLDTLEVDLFGGWTENVHAFHSTAVMRFLLSRTLGHAAPDNVDRPSRAFPISYIYDTMVTTGRTQETRPDKGHARFVMTRREGGTLNHLSPSIANMIPIENDGVLRISGDFGIDPGEAHRTVTISGVEVPIQSWDGFTIETDLPPANLSSGSGPVVVKVDEVASNTVPLAALTGTLTAGFKGEESLRCDLTLRLKFRADPHPFRGDPEVEPKAAFLDADPSGLMDGTLTCSGTSQTPAHCQPNGPTQWTEWSGLQELSASDTAEPPNAMFASLSVSPGLQYGKFMPITYTWFTVTAKDCDGGSSEGMASAPLQLFYDPMNVLPPPGPDAPAEEWERAILSAQMGMEVTATPNANGIVTISGGTREPPPSEPFTGGVIASWADLAWSHEMGAQEPR